MTKHSWHDPHMVYTIKSLCKVLYITLGIFLGLFVTLHISRALYISSLTEKSVKAFEVGIQKDLDYLQRQGDELAVNSELQEYLIARNSEKLIELTQKEIRARNIGLMGVIDSNGVILSRTKSPGNLGNNIFLTSPLGRVLAQGKSAQSVEAVIGFDPRQILVSTGRPVMRDGNMIGALTANYLADDAYAVKFRDTYLPRGTEVVFYNKQAGVYGNSFSGNDTRTLIDSYFNSGSEWMRGEHIEKTIRFEDNSFYLVRNITFPGLEESPGGALIFIPRIEISWTVNFVTACITLLFFLFFAIRYHVHSPNQEKGWRYFVLMCVVSVPVVFVAFSTLQLQNMGYLKLERIPYTLYNSTLRLQPDFGIFDAGFEQRFSVVVDTGDESINVVSIGLLFDPEALEVKAFETASSTCSYVIEQTINAKEGRVDLSCAIFKLGGERGSLVIGDVVVVPKRTGTFTLSFDPEATQVLASDGLGTNVLRTAGKGSYQVDNFDSNLSFGTDDPEATSTKRSFIVFSPTHPNKSRWYNTEDVRFVWKGKAGAVYRYSFDNSPDTIPLDGKTLQDSSVSIRIPGDGIFYFHLQLASGGPVAHYRVQVDMTPPQIMSLDVSSEKIVAGDVVRLSFDAKDVGSGIQKNYYVDLGNHLFLPIGSELFVPFLDAGEQKVILRVYDDANNYSEKTQIIHVEKP